MHFFNIFIYFTSLHVSSNPVLIIRRIELYQYIIWYISLCVDDCLVCRSVQELSLCEVSVSRKFDGVLYISRELSRTRTQLYSGKLNPREGSLWSNSQCVGTAVISSVLSVLYTQQIPEPRVACTYITMAWKPKTDLQFPQNCRRQESNMKQVPSWGATLIIESPRRSGARSFGIPVYSYFPIK